MRLIEKLKYRISLYTNICSYYNDLGGTEMPDIRDPIHGFIKLSQDEMRIISSRPFQRLRRIKQLATTYLVYPSAEHTRFPHSIGVMNISSLIFDKLTEKRSHLLRWSKEEAEKYRQMLRLASLLHDIAHPPFSHAGDDLFDEKVRGHEGMAEILIMNTEISDMIQRIGAPYHFGPSEIAAMITGNIYQKEIRLLVNIFASELDSDKMDYLLRDSLFTGAKYGNYDLDRILNVISLFPKEGTWHLGVEYDGVQAVEGLILARYFMFTQVYLHRTRRIYDKILYYLQRDLLQDKFGAPRFPVTVDDFLNLDDYAVVEQAKNINSPWANKFLNRIHYKCAWETQLSGSPGHKAEQRKLDLLVKQELEEQYSPHQVIVDWYQKAPIKFEVDETPTISVIRQGSPVETDSFRDKAPVIAKLDDPIYIFRVYAIESLHRQIHEDLLMRYEILKGGK